MKCFKKKGNTQENINKYLKKLETWLKNWCLLMAIHKYNHIIFVKYHHNESTSLKLHLFNTILKINNNPTFLGFRFDKQLTFINQIQYLQDTCVNLLNFLKIVLYRNYGLSLATLNQLYI